jgi:hypothetical protein
VCSINLAQVANNCVVWGEMPGTAHACVQAARRVEGILGFAMPSHLHMRGMASYCDNGAIVAAQVPGAIGPTAWKRTTPSSTEQNARTPVVFWVRALAVAS